MISKFLIICSGLALTLLPSLSRADMWAGVGLGPNFSTYTNKPNDSVSGNVNFQIGGYVDYQLQNIWYVEGGLRYNSYGFGVGDTSYDAHYIELPVLVKPTFDLNGWKIYGITGPMLGFKVGESVDSGGTTATTHAAKTVDLSWDFGVGAQYPIMPNLRAFAQFEYDLGITNAIDYANGDSGKTSGAVLSFGVMAAF